MSTQLPITHITLYKHGVGFFQREGSVSGTELTLTFRTAEMDDILKSLTVIDRGSGQVLGIDYATPQTRAEKLAGCAVDLRPDHAFADLLRSLRGRRVHLLLQPEETVTGRLLGLDTTDPQEKTLVSILVDGSADEDATPTAVAHLLSDVRGVAIADEAAADDLTFFLRTSLTQEDYRHITVRLSPGEHDLLLTYIAPAPTWRVSYRLVADTADTAPDDLQSSAGGKTLIQAWGIFDNQLEEQLDDISLTLTAGMPISFTYDLYTPVTPERPHIAEEGRAAADVMQLEAAVEREESRARGITMGDAFMASSAPAPQAKRRAKIRADQMDDSTAINTTGSDLGQLFQYRIGTPVTVGRGQSAMVPILSTTLSHRKQLIYNRSQHAHHPIATLRLENDTDLTLERGPVTVIEDGEYVGEALLSFTPSGGEIVVPYAIELSVHIGYRQENRRETHQLYLEDQFLITEEWDIRRYTYQLDNNGRKSQKILIEHPRQPSHDLVDTPEPAETTADHHRFPITVDGRTETAFPITARRRLRRRQKIINLTYQQLHQILQEGLITAESKQRIAELHQMMAPLADYDRRIQEITAEQQQIRQAQEQVRKNMSGLSQAGKEGKLRSEYVDRLTTQESNLHALQEERERLKEQGRLLRQKIEDYIATW